MKKFFIYSLSILLGLLFYWLIGFVLEDTAQRPAFVQEPALTQLNTMVNQYQRRIADTQSQQAVLKNNMQNTQSIINQIAGIQKGKPASVDLIKNTDLFLKQQSQLQQLNQTLLQLNTTLLPLQDQRDELLVKKESQYKNYRFKIGLIQTGELLILLLLTSFIVRKRSASPYKIIWQAINVAVLVKIFFVIHDYFPSRYFKYILILALMVVVWIALRKLINKQLSPDKKQYRFAYAKFLCGVCEFPIRRKDNEIYVCPSCGTNLFNKCTACGEVKHNLLSYCEHCGATSQ